jgi:hypothetical protein
LKLVFIEKEEASAKRESEGVGTRRSIRKASLTYKQRTFEVQQRKLDLAKVKERARPRK